MVSAFETEAEEANYDHRFRAMVEEEKLVVGSRVLLLDGPLRAYLSWPVV